MDRDGAHAGLFLTENIKEAICAISEGEFDKFFNSLAQGKLNLIETAKPDQLTHIQSQVKMVTELKGIFLSIRMSAKRKREQQDKQ